MGITDKQAEILKFIGDNPNISKTQIAKKLVKCRAWIDDLIVNLTGQEFIESKPVEKSAERLLSCSERGKLAFNFLRLKKWMDGEMSDDEFKRIIGKLNEKLNDDKVLWRKKQGDVAILQSSLIGTDNSKKD